MWLIKLLIKFICEGILNGIYIGITAMCGIMCHDFYCNNQILLSLVAMAIFVLLLNFYHTFKDIITL